MSHQLNYKRATRVTVAAMAILVLLILFEIMREHVMVMHTPTEIANDSGECVGIFFGAIAAFVGVLVAAIGFSATAKFLVARSGYSILRFLGILQVSLALIAFAMGALIGQMLGSLAELPLLAALFFSLFSLFTMPFALVWHWLAR